ncbi:MAG: GNAT family N-acetyltransferase [Candidatus Velthaea sp.]
MHSQTIAIRTARTSDVSSLTALIDASVRELQAGDYTAQQREGALRAVYGVDTQLIDDGTYYVATIGAGIAGCGGWSKRKTLYGGDRWTARDDDLLDPRMDAAKIRAFFVHPDFTRRGVASRILETCERAARAVGFTRLEMGATLTGVAFYLAHGYVLEERLAVPLLDGIELPIVRMTKSFPPNTFIGGNAT